MTENKSEALQAAKDDAMYCCHVAATCIRVNRLEDAMYWLTQAVYEVAKAQRFRTDERTGTQ